MRGLSSRLKMASASGSSPAGPRRERVPPLPDVFLSFVRVLEQNVSSPPGFNAQPLSGCEVQLHPSLSTW